ncbi:serum amyloid P-component-like [Latimeria chalumnae]|uniref:serum amyloid P-component-like n=1 Tax=Latimeria chalumnae TaxID=7897 RepID=UPI00313CAB09
MRSTFFVFFLVIKCLYGKIVEGEAGLGQKTLIFPVESADSYVTLKPDQQKFLQAFTVCLKAYTDLNRYVAVFSFATSASANDILIERNSKGEYTLIVGGDKVHYKTEFKDDDWMHFCVSWESETGLVVFRVNGKQFVAKALKKGYAVHSDPKIILGQEQDSYGGTFDKAQSFVGEMKDVNMWDYVLSPYEIQLVEQGSHSVKGNMINWETVHYTVNGNVIIKSLEVCCGNNTH